MESQRILAVCRKYFPHVDRENFEDLFKLTPEQIATHVFHSRVSRFRNTNLTGVVAERCIRDFLIFVYWCRNYPSFRHLGALFGLKHERVRKIVKRQVQILASTIRDYVNLNDLDTPDDAFFQGCVGAVDCTELPIWTWVGDAYSGKKKCFSLKYQVIVCLVTKRALQISGPFFGKAADITVWRLSGMAEFLESEDFWVLGDKGYVGGQRVKHCLKKRRGQHRLSRRNKAYNKMISTKRVFVENHFSELKVFKAVAHCFRGHLEDHVDIFYSCEILLQLSKS